MPLKVTSVAYMYDVKLSRRLKLINYSWADNSLKSNVSGTVSVPIIRAMILLWPTFYPVSSTIPKWPDIQTSEVDARASQHGTMRFCMLIDH
jgi:hypothetical protein